MEAFLFYFLHDSYASRQRRAACHQEHEGGVSEIPIVEWEELVCLEDSVAAKSTKGTEEACRAAALWLVRCGELSRASKVLTSAGLAPSTADTAKKLASKHPPRVKSIDLLNTPHSAAINLSENVFCDTVRRSPRGSGVGPSGWRFEHFKVLIDNENTAKCLFSACSAIAKGILPPEIAQLMSSSRLIALSKSNGDLRPIAVGDALRRRTDRAICAQKKEAFADYFTPIQHGVSTQNGTELVAHHIGLMLEVNQNWIVLKSDVRNAFNSISRCDMLKEVSKAFPDLFSHIQQMYGHSSSLVYLQGLSSIVIPSQEGVHQGDPLGPVLLATTSYFI